MEVQQLLNPLKEPESLALYFHKQRLRRTLETNFAQGVYKPEPKSLEHPRASGLLALVQSRI